MDSPKLRWRYGATASFVDWDAMESLSNVQTAPNMSRLLQITNEGVQHHQNDSGGSLNVFGLIGIFLGFVLFCAVVRRAKEECFGTEDLNVDPSNVPINLEDAELGDLTGDQRKEFIEKHLLTDVVPSTGYKERTTPSSAAALSLKSDMQNESPEQRGVCAICLMDYCDNDEYCYSSNVECPHTFHRECIIEWLARRDDCPCCRKLYLPREGANGRDVEAATGDNVRQSAARNSSSNNNNNNSDRRANNQTTANTSRAGNDATTSRTATTAAAAEDDSAANVVVADNDKTAPNDVEEGTTNDETEEKEAASANASEDNDVESNAKDNVDEKTITVDVDNAKNTADETEVENQDTAEDSSLKEGNSAAAASASASAAAPILEDEKAAETNVHEEGKNSSTPNSIVDASLPWYCCTG